MMHFDSKNRRILELDRSTIGSAKVDFVNKNTLKQLVIVTAIRLIT